MPDCHHRHLTLLPAPTGRLRCRHCHLTLSKEELGGNPCPECYERDGARRYDFDKIDPETAPPVRYRCDDCGALIE